MGGKLVWILVSPYATQMTGKLNIKTFENSHFVFSKKIISTVLNPHKDSLDQLGFSIRESTVASLISSAKSRGDPNRITWGNTSLSKGTNSSQALAILQEVAIAYNQALRDLNGLDFDDLLLFGVQLVKDHPVVDIRHLLVDELYDVS
jgi:DNA helicase-2/ATP-dependent DNA helicase PcrA